MIPPKKRLWLYPVGEETLEIVLLGNSNVDDTTPEADNIAGIFVHIRALAERWPGWDRVDVLVMGAAVVGLRVQLGKLASHGDPVAEALKMLADARGLRWSGGNPASDSSLGMVATW